MGTISANDTDDLTQEIRELHGRGMYDEAIRLAERSAEAIVAQHGPEHPELADALYDLALRLRDCVLNAEAEPVMRRALAICEKNLAPEHPDVAAGQILAGLQWSHGIYREYVDGSSALEIAGRLNRERIAAPRGREWNASTINGSRKRQNGIINNRLYIGKIVYNRQRFIKDPVTGRRQARPNLPSEWIEQEVPELAIVPLELFEAAQRRRSRYSAARLSHRRRPRHLLSGLVHCGCCGASMIIARDDRVGCSARMNKMTCDNRRTILLAEIEARILKVLQEHLLTPDVVTSAVEKYRVERERLAKGRAKRGGRRSASWLR